MKIIKKRPIPFYEVTCPECKSIIGYKASEVSWHHITCPVCKVLIWVNPIQSTMREQPKEDVQ